MSNGVIVIYNIGLIHCVCVSCSVVSDSMDCSPLGSSIHGILQARILELSCHFLLQGIFLTQGSNLGLLHCRQLLYHLSHQGSLDIF